MVDVTDPTLTNIPMEDGDGSELIGHIIDGRYKLEATLGRGGMGLVYRASHVEMRRAAAVKILHPSLVASSDVRNRFEREKLALAKINHPNCVTTYDVGRLSDGSLYLAMELLEGKSLADVLEREGQLTPERSLHILAHILRGLDHVHRAGLIHRDMKPENIYLVKKGDDEDFAKILDFGIAKPMAGELADDGVKLTQAGMAFGTPIYMAPEQALGNKMDGRADVYAAAVVGYEMLCGRPPFYSDDKLEVMSMHTAKPVPPMRQQLIRNGKPVPVAIEKMILKGLTKKPQDRYASAEMFLEAVEHALEAKERTDVEFQRPTTTGSQSLVTDSGEVRIATGQQETASEAIGDAIEEALSAPTPAPKLATPPRGTAQRSVTPPIPARVERSQPMAPARADRSAPVKRPPSEGPRAERSQPMAPARTDRSQPMAPARTESEPPTALRMPGAAPAGGVGLGLPYTGPEGEPIFGLTPEQRLAGAIDMPRGDTWVEGARWPTTADVRPTKKKKRWPLYAAIAGAAVVAGIVIAIATRPSGPPVDDKPLAPKYARDAYASLESGDLNNAQSVLDANKDAAKVDPLAMLVQGLIYADTDAKQWPVALQLFRASVIKDPSLATDPKMRANLRAMAGAPDASEAVIADAFDVWLASGDNEAKEKAAKAAVAPADPARRHAAKRAIDRHRNLNVKVDWLAAYVLDLQDQKTCPLRKEALGQLHALGDKRAIPIIQEALKQQRNQCLVQEAKATIGYLNTLPQMIELPDLPRWVEAHGIAASGEGWVRGNAIGHDAAKLIVLFGDVDVDLIRAHPDHTLLFPLELAPQVATADRIAVRALLHTLHDPSALPDLDGAVPLASVPVDLPFADELARARGTVWTAWVDDAPVSFAHAVWRSDKWFDVSVDTLPAARQLGLATIVTAALIRDERAHGREPVWGADEDNHASRRLAKRLGFEPIDEIGVATSRAR